MPRGYKRQQSGRRCAACDRGNKSVPKPRPRRLACKMDNHLALFPPPALSTLRKPRKPHYLAVVVCKAVTAATGEARGASESVNEADEDLAETRNSKLGQKACSYMGFMSRNWKCGLPAHPTIAAQRPPAILQLALQLFFNHADSLL